MSKRSTCLFAGLAMLAFATPLPVSAQRARIDMSQTARQFTGKRDNAVTKLPYQAFFLSGGQNHKRKAPERETSATYDVPYLEEFNDDSDINTYSVIDANDDGRTWEYDILNKGMHYHYSVANPGDDWLVTPGINLQAGKTYIVAFRSKAEGKWFDERIEAKWGNANTVAGLTNELLPSTDLTGGDDWQTFTKSITPDSDGPYYFGFHAISDKNMYYLDLDSISVTLAPDNGVPDSVVNLKAASGQTASPTVVLSFTTPTSTISGDQLSSIDSVKILRGNSVIGSVKPVSPGADYSYTDATAEAGSNNYSVIAVNDKGDGRLASISAFAGPDAPSAPSVTATDNLTDVKFTWPNVGGANGGYVAPAGVQYEIYNVDNDGYLGSKITTVQNANEYDLPYNTNTGDQHYTHWAFRAVNDKGSSNYSATAIITGAPYTLPYSNSFAGGTLENQFFGLVTDGQGFASWGLASDKTSDQDNGSIEFTNAKDSYGYLTYGPGYAILSTGKISINGANSPKLTFDYNGTVSTDTQLDVELKHINGNIDTLKVINFNDGDDEWKTATIDLPAAVTGEPYIILQFRGVAETSDVVDVFLDNIHISDPLQNDAAISIKAPGKVYKGQTADIETTISNLGVTSLSDLNVKLYVNDAVIADTTIAQPLAFNGGFNIKTAYKTSSLDNTTSLNVRAEVSDNGDQDLSNNAATTTVRLEQADVNAPTDLTGDASGHLSWTAPEANIKNENESFENYTPWATTGVGDWTFINADGGYFGAVSREHVEPNYGDSAAYEVWHPDGIFEPNPKLDAHTGSQCLVSVFKMDKNMYGYVDCDDWLISPELPGEAQTISFWANDYVFTDDDNTEYGVETFRVLASSTTKETSSFIQLSSYTMPESGWKNYTVDLPEGTKYFAIRRVTKGIDGFLFFVDDISFKSGTTAASYNIYEDGNLIGNTEETDFNVTANGSHSYAVTAVYSNGSESLPVTIDLTANSIDDIHAQLKADKYDVYTIGGAQVKLGAKSLNGLTPGVYVINGKKIILK